MIVVHCDNGDVYKATREGSSWHKLVAMVLISSDSVSETDYLVPYQLDGPVTSVELCDQEVVTRMLTSAYQGVPLKLRRVTAIK